MLNKIFLGKTAFHPSYHHNHHIVGSVPLGVSRLQTGFCVSVYCLQNSSSNPRCATPLEINRAKDRNSTLVFMVTQCAKLFMNSQTKHLKKKKRKTEAPISFKDAIESSDPSQAGISNTSALLCSTFIDHLSSVNRRVKTLKKFRQKHGVTVGFLGIQGGGGKHQCKEERKKHLDFQTWSCFVRFLKEHSSRRVFGSRIFRWEVQKSGSKNVEKPEITLFIQTLN